jgi:hypothetical protein
LRLLLWCPCFAGLLAAFAAGAYAAHSAMTKLKITSFLMAKRKHPPQKKICSNELCGTFKKTLAGSVPLAGPKRPTIIPCLDA